MKRAVLTINTIKLAPATSYRGTAIRVGRVYQLFIVISRAGSIRLAIEEYWRGLLHYTEGIGSTEGPINILL
ncbi:unnamed protein product [Nezara viridula]|uniref:Uncharacterized protein n=1 Tax=Nezara viridula TaxID=85310 RepID=A0A9P0MY72_NEZVI|nr:unnamed protein product [Nezara viridula]